MAHYMDGRGLHSWRLLPRHPRDPLRSSTRNRINRAAWRSHRCSLSRTIARTRRSCWRSSSSKSRSWRWRMRRPAGSPLRLQGPRSARPAPRGSWRRARFCGACSRRAAGRCGPRPRPPRPRPRAQADRRVPALRRRLAESSLGPLLVIPREEDICTDQVLLALPQDRQNVALAQDARTLGAGKASLAGAGAGRGPARRLRLARRTGRSPRFARLRVPCSTPRTRAPVACTAPEAFHFPAAPFNPVIQNRLGHHQRNPAVKYAHYKHMWASGDREKASIGSDVVAELSAARGILLNLKLSLGPQLRGSEPAKGSAGAEGVRKPQKSGDSREQDGGATDSGQLPPRDAATVAAADDEEATSSCAAA